MNRFALIIPALFFSQLAFSQVDQIVSPVGVDAQQNLLELGNPPNSSMVRLFDNRYEGVKGSPFFNAEWVKATVSSNKTLYDNLEVKYNVNENEILYRNPDGKEFVLKPQHVDSFTLKDGKSITGVLFKKFPALASHDPKLANQFAVALYEGAQMQLVMVPQKNFIKANFEGAYNSGNAYDELRDDYNYFLIAPTQAVNKVKLTKRNFLKALPANQGKVEKYIESERLDMNTENGWIKALVYYESL